MKFTDRLTVNEEKVLICMHTWGLTDNYFDGHIWRRYETMAHDTGIEIKELKKAMQTLRDKGMVYFTPAIDTEGVPNGSGWFTTSQGETKAGLLYEKEDETK